MNRSTLSSMQILTLISLACATSAQAGLVTVGGAREHGSWIQAFNESGVTFDHMQITLLSGPAFETPTTFQNFSDGSWGQTFSDGTVAVADGNALNNLNFDIIFSGVQAQVFTFAFQAYNGEMQVEDAFAQWDGNAFNISAGSSLPDTRITPTPGTLALMGLGGSVAARRRRA